MKYENRICCFIDILGFRNHIEETVNSNNEDRVDKIQSIIGIIELSRSLTDHGEYEVAKSKKVTQFSDSIVISFKIDERSQVFYSLLDLLYVAIELANKGYLARGGVIFGKLIHTSEYIFGPALNYAYELESKHAIFPRIIVDPSVPVIGRTFKGDQHSADYEEESIMKLLSRDDDGRLYIDYIAKSSSEFDDPKYDLLVYIENLKKVISSTVCNTQSQGVLDKMNWLKNKLNELIRSCKKRAYEVDNYDGDYDIVEAYRELETID